MNDYTPGEARCQNLSPVARTTIGQPAPVSPGNSPKGEVAGVTETRTAHATAPGMLKAPFPWFGGKFRASHRVWTRLGDCPNYVEPFFGSGAVLLGRPHPPQIETVNDMDGFICNFYRAIQHDPEQTAHYADAPVNECDIHARHIWLLNRRADLTARLEGDPDYYDAKIAGWWVWGICCWIGSGWCSGNGTWQSVDGKMTNAGKNGTKRQRPHLGDAGQGVNRNRPQLGGHQLSQDGVGTINSNIDIYAWFDALSARLRRVRVCCGNWSRVMGPSVTFRHGLTGVFLDPPYSAEAGRDMGLYAVDCGKIAHEAKEWAISNGENPLLRIALCGYEGEHAMPGSWECVPWKTHGGMSNQGNGPGRDNKFRERVWFSPHCLKSDQGRLF